MDLHLQVDPRISVSEGHQIGDTVRRRLLEHVGEVTDVTVHIDPEDDEQGSSCGQLPLRSKLIQSLIRHWHEADIDGIADHQVTLHYLDGGLQIELCLPLSVLDARRDVKAFIRGIEAAARKVPEVQSVHVSFHA